MPIPVPGSGRASPRRRQPPRPQGPRRENESIHSSVAAERLDETASLSIDTSSSIDVIAELLTVGDLLTFATDTLTITSAPALTTASFAQPGNSDSSYVKDAQAGAGSNPARSDLDGLAPNTYALKMAAAQAFTLKPGSIGGRAYRPYKSDHTTGHAIDIPGSGDQGQVIAQWVIDRAAQYKVKYIIHADRIWYPGKGWQAYNPSSAVSGFASDARHLRHVHVSTY